MTTYDFHISTERAMNNRLAHLMLSYPFIVSFLSIQLPKAQFFRWPLRWYEELKAIEELDMTEETNKKKTDKAKLAAASLALEQLARKK